jgi:hypothetical protein
MPLSRPVPSHRYKAATVKATWRTGKSRGRVTTELTVPYRFADDETRYLTLGLRGVVVPDLDYTPDRLTFSIGVQGERSLSYTPRPGSGVAVTDVTTTHRAFRAWLVGGEGRAIVAFDSAAWPRDALPTSARLVLRTTSPAEPDVEVDLVVTDGP